MGEDDPGRTTVLPDHEGEMPSGGTEPPDGSIRRAVAGVGEAIDEVIEAGERLAGLGQPITKTLRERAGSAARRVLEPTHRIREGRVARARRLARLNRQPLPNLFDIHPEARLAARRELGLRTIPVDEIQGTAVEGPPQRGRDFLPRPELRNSNWDSRWQRLKSAQERMSILPPIDVLQTAEGYWVTDGHNRVALALYTGQLEIDALVTLVRLTDQTAPEVTTGSLAAMLAEGEDLRAAGTGLLTPGSTLESRVPDPMSEPTGPGEEGQHAGDGAERDREDAEDVDS